MKKTALGMGPLHMLPKTASKSEVPLKSYFPDKQVWQTYIYIYKDPLGLPLGPFWVQNQIQRPK